MSKKTKHGFLAIFLLVLAAVLSGCGSSSSSGSSSTTTTSDPTAASGSDSLTLSSKVSVVDAKADSDLSSSIAAGSDAIELNGARVTDAISRSIAVSGFAADSDYKKDKIDVWVQEESIQAFNTVNEILCSIDQSRYAEMKGKGDYRAQIDTSLCSNNKDDASSQIKKSQNQSSSSNAASYEEWVVNSSREDGQPHIVKVWIDEEAQDEGDVNKMIMAKMLIYQSSSDTNPFGQFKMNFVAYPVDSSGNAVTTGDPLMKGYMRTVIDNATGDTLLQFSNTGSFGSDTFKEQATFRRNSDGNGGSGTLSSPVWSESGVSGYAVYDIAYDDNYFARRKDSTTACFSRTSFDKTVWDYSMYDSTGTRVKLNSGFPIKYGDYYGWVGYYGIWLPDQASISNGDTVYKQSYNSGTTTEDPYTVFIANGRLIKHTKQTMTLGDLKNVPMQWWDNNSEYRVIWNGSNLVKTATLDNTNWTWTELSSPQTLDLSSGGNYAFNFWSEALGGSGFFELVNNSGSYTAPTDSTVVTFHVEDVVYPTDTIPSTLKCFENCPDAAAVANSSATTLTKTDKSMYANGTAPSAFTYYEYTFSASDMLLKDGGTAVVMSQKNSNSPWGFQSGILFEGSSANYTALQCAWNASDTCNFQAWNDLSVYYTWETGPDSWNKFTAIKSGSTYARFDAPMKVTYQHTQTNTSAYDYKYNGAKFQLEYQGYGSLNGIPGHCINESGENIQCGSNTRWIPEFNIMPGATVTGVTNSTEYVVKPLHVEQRMSKLSDTSSCSGLTLTSYTLPDATNWEDPNIGTKPTITDAPAVIGGVVQ